MKKIKVLFIGMTNNLGGVEVFGRNLIMNSDHNKMQFTIMVGDNVTTPFQDELIAQGVNIVRFGFRKDGYRKCLEDIKKIYKENDYDIIHINLMTYSPFELIKYACKYSRGIVVVHSHNTGYRNKYYKARLMHFVGKKMLKGYCFEKIACGVEAGRYLFGNDDFKVLYNGVDFDKFRFSKKNRDTIRAELGIEGNCLVLGDVASFLPQKNQEFLIKVFSELKKKKKNSKLVLVGTGKNLTKCKRLASRLGLADDILFLGRRNDIEKIYSALDVYVMPSISEGLSIAICEAQVNGLPCITSCGVSRESNISGNVKFLGFHSTREWVDEIMASSVRRDRCNLVPEKYNIYASMEGFYKYYSSLIRDRGRNDEKEK